ncbi:MOSC domain-containing protein [Paracoccus tegillarcae]|nr:MOSC domain-containing protein [Paracoccus tegillarcae]
MARLARIRRHPVKSVGGEDLDEVSLSAHRRLPGDREWAVLHEAGERLAQRQTDADWLPKSVFLNTAKSHPLQAVQGGWSGEVLNLTHPEHGQVSANPDTDGEMLIDWLQPLWPDDRGAATRLVHSPSGWTDEPKPFVSILSLSSLAALEQAMGQKLDVERWRGNLWVDGWAEFAERDLLGKTIRIGTVELRIDEPIGRCTAPSGSATTGETDCDMLASLKRFYDHTDFGVFATVMTDGAISVGDEVVS